jgi:hypothetical protein
MRRRNIELFLQPGIGYDIFQYSIERSDGGDFIPHDNIFQDYRIIDIGQQDFLFAVIFLFACQRKAAPQHIAIQ